MNYVKITYRRAFLPLGVLLLLVSCVREPVISSFTVSQTQVTAGTSVTLSWQVTQADRVTLTSDMHSETVEVVSAGSRSEVVTTTTTFTLTAFNGRRSSRSTQTVTVVQSGDDENPDDGDPDDDPDGGDDSDDDDSDDDGKDDDNDDSDDDDTDEDDETALPVISSFTATPDSVISGTDVTLAWTVTGAEILSISGNVGDVTGQENQSITVTETTTYVLTATNSNGSVTAETTVTVGDLPTIDSFSISADKVSFGEQVTLNWTTSNADEVSITSVTGSLPLNGMTEVIPAEATTYTLTASNAFATVTQDVTVDVWLTLMIAGQSNAVGWQPLNAPGVVVEENTTNIMMFANDDSWKMASEPVDNNSGQNSGHGGFNSNPGHSFGVRVGNNLQKEGDADRFQVALLPTAKGGADVFQANDRGWRPKSTDLRDRTTVFGDALTRAELLKADQSLRLSAILWYQGEADSQSNCFYCRGYVRNTKRVFETLSQELKFTDEGRNIPIIYVQLSHFGDNPGSTESTNNARHLGWQDIREKQRLLEAGAYNPVNGATSLCAVSHMHMVVAHDLAMFDRSHLTAASQKILGDRIDRAIREHILGENIDGTGPRLAGITKTGNQIRISTTRTINPNNGSNYGNYFSVFNQAGNEVSISSIQRDANKPTDILLTLASDPGPGYSVRYMPPRIPQGSNPPDDGVGLPVDITDDVIHHVTADGVKLPLPAFGRAVQISSTLDPSFPPDQSLAGQCTTYDVAGD
jgi:hypothetical protein